GRWPLSQCPTIEPIVSQAHFGLSWEVSPRISTKAPSSTATERKHEVVGVQIDVLRLPGRGGPTPHEHRYGNDRRTTTRPRMNNRWDDCEGELNFSHKPELRSDPFFPPQISVEVRPVFPQVAAESDHPQARFRSCSWRQCSPKPCRF